MKGVPPSGNEYAPCPDCGGVSLAEFVDHICDLCADAYIYCIDCGIERDGFWEDDEDDEDLE